MKNNISKYMHRYSNENKTRRKVLFCFVGITFFVMLILNFNTGYMADDYSYINSTSLLDVFRDEYTQYMTWGGRSVVHILARIFLMLPKFIFNIANSLIYTWLTVLIYLYANYNKKTKVSLYLFIVSCCFIFIPVFGQTVFWVTGSCNYLWGTTIILTFLLPYRIYITKKFTLSKHKNSLFILFMFLFGIIAGWCNENTSGGCILFIILMILYALLNKIKLQLWLFSGLIGSIIGFGFMLLSPGNAIRAQNFTSEYSNFTNLIINFKGCTKTIINLFLNLIILFVIFVIIHLLAKKNIKNIIIPFIYLLIGFAIVYAMILSPTGPNEQRAFFGACVFFIIAVSSLFAKFDLSIDFNKKFLYLLTAILFMQYTSTLFDGYVDILNSNDIYKQREIYISEQKKLGNLDITLPEIKPITKYNSLYGIGDLTKLPEFWINDVFAKYHKINSAKTISYDDWKLYKKRAD